MTCLKVQPAQAQFSGLPAPGEQTAADGARDAQETDIVIAQPLPTEASLLVHRRIAHFRL